MKGIYLCARSHRLPGFDIDYNDIENLPGINVPGDCLLVDLEKYDYIIATPPCNYWSRFNSKRETSKVAQETKHLLIDCLERCIKLGKPFIVENVLIPNYLRPKKYDEYKFTYGTHTFWSNVKITVPGKVVPNCIKGKHLLPRNKRDNNYQVDIIIKLFLNTLY